MSVAACCRSSPPNRPGSACSTTARYPDSLRLQVIEALIERRPVLELEATLRCGKSTPRHLWLQLRLPENPGEWHAVTLSLSDVTSRKEVELSLIERESSGRTRSRRCPIPSTSTTCTRAG